jgi:Fe2+ transport system protein FeoA
VGIMIEAVSWDVMASKAAKHKSGNFLDRTPPHTEIVIVALPKDADQVRMLEQLGIREEAHGHVRSAAPMGGPVLLEIGGSAVAIARGVAKKIRVRIL